MTYHFRKLLLTTTALIPLGSTAALANPLGSQVVGGTANVQGQGTASVTVTQSTPNAIINWNSFNIGVGETTRFVQPTSNSVTLNRVTGNLGPSFLDGTLTANGRIFLVNPDGILFGANSKINTSGFLATTNDIKNDDLMAGRYQFTTPGRPNASIVNQGTITAQNAGFAALVAPGLRNTGTITAKLGTVGLASGNGFSLDFYGDKLITLGVTDSIAGKVIDVATGQALQSLVQNDGKLKANGGRVELTAAAARQVVDSVIKTTGVIEANSIGKQNGMIVLGAATSATKPAGAPAQTVKLSGTLSAAGKRRNTQGGTVVVTGENIELASANVDASGQAGGGKVLIGGDVGGGKGNVAVASNSKATLESFSVPNASTVNVDTLSTINASAKNKGDGGKVVVWSDQATTFYGTISAEGGTQSGSGGLVETSSHQSLTYEGSVSTSATNGKTGAFLLDPMNVTLASTAGNGVITTGSIVTALQTNFVVVTTGSSGNDLGDLTVASNIIWNGLQGLSLIASHNVIINDGVTIKNVGDGSLNLVAGLSANITNGIVTGTGTGSGTVLFAGSGSGRIDFSQSTGAIRIVYNPIGGYAHPSDFSSKILVNPAAVSSGPMSFPTFVSTSMLVNNVNDLQNLSLNLSGDYSLLWNIDASATASWNGGAGFIPIGTAANPFAGSLSGGGIISNLTIHSSAQDVGLFGVIANPGIGYQAGVQQIGLTNVNISSTTVGAHVGALAGKNQTPLEETFATGIVIGGTSSVVGGLVGLNSGDIFGSYARGTVGTGSGGFAGGLVGTNAGYISASYSAGSFSSSSGIRGGLVGSGSPSNVFDSHWDVQTSGLTTSAGGVAELSSSLKSITSLLPFQSLYPGAPSGWMTDGFTNGGYPFRSWQLPEVVPPTTTVFVPTANSLPQANPLILVNNTQTISNLIKIDTTTANSTPAAILPVPQSKIETLSTPSQQAISLPNPSSSNTASQAAPSSLVAPLLQGTENKTGEYQTVSGETLSGQQTATWGLTSNGFKSNGAVTPYAPIDTMTFYANGKQQTLAAYANVDSSGKPSSDGPLQCTALVSQYLDLLGFKNAPLELPNGKDVALAVTRLNPTLFDSSVNNAPKVGSIISMATNDVDVGHVAIVKGVSQKDSNTVVVTLIEDNLTFNHGATFAVDRQITFSKGADGNWSAKHVINPDSGNSYNVLSWATPIMPPP